MTCFNDELKRFTEKYENLPLVSSLATPIYLEKVLEDGFHRLRTVYENDTTDHLRK